MTKDPAFMFYSQDFIVGTLAMPFEERGRYITLMCYQHQTGHISEETIRLLVGSFSDMLRLKFKQDENGLFFNERLDEEIEKRVKFRESRETNGKLGGRPKKLEKPSGYPNGKPTDNLPEDENEDVIIIPFELQNDLFIEKWKILISMPKWKKKPDSSIEQSLNKLKKYNVFYAIELIENAISGNYQGVCFADTESKYKDWLKSKPELIINEKSPKWKIDFDVYKSECKSWFHKLYNDEEFIVRLQYYYPNSDIKKLMDSEHKTYWSTNKGWDKKRFSEEENIDWVDTIEKCIKYNHKFYSKSYQKVTK